LLSELSDPGIIIVFLVLNLEIILQSSRFALQVFLGWCNIFAMKNLDAQKELAKIVRRNKRVEGDKAWEVSKFRAVTILVFIYIVAFVYMLFLKVEGAWMHAFVPVIGYFMSSLSLPHLKKWWIQHYKR